MINWKRKADALETRQLAPVQGIKADADKPGLFTGYASTWRDLDAYNEKVMPGACTESLVKHKQRGTQVRMFWSHDQREPLGRWLDIAEDNKGLFVQGQLNLAVNRAKEAHALMLDGSVDGLSIGYRVQEAEENEGVLELTKIDLLEISIVALPANIRATVDTVKNDDPGEKFMKLCRALREGAPRPAKEFEDILREAGVPKSVATTIASVGYAKAIRSDSGGASEAFRELGGAVAGYLRNQ